METQSEERPSNMLQFSVCNWVIGLGGEKEELGCETLLSACLVSLWDHREWLLELMEGAQCELGGRLMEKICLAHWIWWWRRGGALLVFYSVEGETWGLDLYEGEAKYDSLATCFPGWSGCSFLGNACFIWCLGKRMSCRNEFWRGMSEQFILNGVVGGVRLPQVIIQRRGWL